MTPGIYVGSKLVPEGIRRLGNLDPASNRAYQHLYLVYRDASGQETVIRGGPDRRNVSNLSQGFMGSVGLDYNIPLANSEDAYQPGETAITRNERLIVGGDQASAMWNRMLTTAAEIRDKIIASETGGRESIARYDFTERTQNSNSVVAAVLSANGFTVDKALPNGVSIGQLPGVTNLLSQVLPNNQAAQSLLTSRFALNANLALDPTKPYPDDYLNELTATLKNSTYSGEPFVLGTGGALTNGHLYFINPSTGNWARIDRAANQCRARVDGETFDLSTQDCAFFARDLSTGKPALFLRKNSNSPYRRVADFDDDIGMINSPADGESSLAVDFTFATDGAGAFAYFTTADKNLIPVNTIIESPVSTTRQTDDDGNILEITTNADGSGVARALDPDGQVINQYTLQRTNDAGVGAIDGQNGILTGQINGQAAVFAADFGYSEDEGTTIDLTGVEINGAPPANAPLINAALQAGQFTGQDLLQGNGNLNQIAAAADPTNASGTPPLPATSTPAPTPGSPSWAAWVNSEEGKRFYAALTNTQNLLAAAQGGNPVPLVQDIFNFADSALQETNPILASQFGGAANGLGTVNSFRSLARAIERGDPVEIARSGAPVASYIISTYAASLSNQIISQFGVANIAEAQAERFWNQSQGTPNQNLNELLDQYSGTQNLLESINRGLPYLQLLSGLKNGDPISIGIGGAYVGGQIGLWAPVGQAGSAAASFVTTLNWIGAIVVIIQLLRGDDDARALVQAASTGDGRSVTAQLVGSPEDGGDGPALATYAELIKAVNKLIEQRADQGIIASRLPQLEFYAGDKRKLDQGFYKLVWTDEAGNRQERQYRYNGSLAATGGDELAQMPEFFLNLVENYTRLAQESGAIAPSWIVQTIDAQVARSVPIPIYEDRPRYGAEREIVGYDRVQVGSTLPANADPDAGLTTEQRAAMREQLLATDPGDASSNNAGGNTAASQQSVRPIVLDLEGNGIQLTRRANAGGVLLDVDDDGFAEQTDWIGAKEGILVADLDGDGQIRGGHEMFNDSQVDMSQRGLEVLREYDANGDGTITAADAALNHLKIWQDVNHDGIAQSHELSTLAQNSITELNYSTGQFTQSNAQGSVQKTLVLAELVASSAGVVSLQHHKHYEFNSTSRIFYAGYLPEMIQKEAGNDVSWRSAA